MAKKWNREYVCGSCGAGWAHRDTICKQCGSVDFRRKLKTKPIKCPICGGLTAVRKNRITGESFYGCCRFPECRGTRPCTQTGAKRQFGSVLSHNDPRQKKWRQGKIAADTSNEAPF